MMGSGVRVPSAAPLSHTTKPSDIQKGLVNRGLGCVGCFILSNEVSQNAPEVGAFSGGIANDPTMPLTDARNRTLKPKDKPYKLGDFDGLYVTVTPTGSRLWHLKYRFDGKEKRLSFGAYPSVSLADARSLKDKARARLAIGEDPGALKQEKKRAERERLGITFAVQAEAFVEKARKEGRAKSTMDKTEWLLGMANEAFGSKPITDVNAPMILECLKRVEAKGNYETARRLRAKIGAVFRFAVANGVAEADPTYALRDALITPTVKSRAAITDKNALGGLLRAIDAFHGQTTTRIALQLLALLAQRPGELRHATWKEFDI
ncbi:MAG: integrase arm-type DNA-binding domain-containing protein [Pseudomonadota bacterium]